MMNADGSEQTNLTNDPDWDNSPRWSPDGSKIAFVTWRHGNDGSPDLSEIYVMYADSTEQIRLTNDSAFDHSPT